MNEDDQLAMPEYGDPFSSFQPNRTFPELGFRPGPATWDLPPSSEGEPADPIRVGLRSLQLSFTSLHTKNLSDILAEQSVSQPRFLTVPRASGSEPPSPHQTSPFPIQLPSFPIPTNVTLQLSFS